MDHCFDRTRFKKAARDVRKLNGHRAGLDWSDVTACAHAIVTAAKSVEIPKNLRTATAAAFGTFMEGPSSNRMIRHFLEPLADRIAQPETIDQHDQEIAVAIFEALAAR